MKREEIEARLCRAETTGAGAVNRSGKIHYSDTYLSVNEETVDEPAMLQVHKAIVEHMAKRGFALGPDPFVESFIAGYRRPRFKPHEAAAWRARHGYGIKHGLEFACDTFGRCWKIDFFQNVANVENSNGGRYDFRRYSRMPCDMRTRFVVEVVNLIRLLMSFGYSLSGDLQEPLASWVLKISEGRAEEGLTPLDHYARHAWSMGGKCEHGWPIEAYPNYGRKDRDGVMLKPGDLRCFYQLNRLVQARAYPDGGMWTMRSEDGSFLDKKNGTELFSPDSLPDHFPRRRVLTKNERVAKINSAIRVAKLRGDERRVDAAKSALARLVDEPLYYVLDLKRATSKTEFLGWWRPNAAGYCYRLEDAGRYLASEIERYEGYYNNGESTAAILCEHVDKSAVLVSSVTSTDIETSRTPTDHVVRTRKRAALVKKRKVNATKAASAA